MRPGELRAHSSAWSEGSYFQIQELEEHKPPGVKIKFDDPNTLHDFYVIIAPEEGFWQGGKYKFHVKVRSVLS